MYDKIVTTFDWFQFCCGWCSAPLSSGHTDCDYLLNTFWVWTFLLLNVFLAVGKTYYYFVFFISSASYLFLDNSFTIFVLLSDTLLSAMNHCFGNNTGCIQQQQQFDSNRSLCCLQFRRVVLCHIYLPKIFTNSLLTGFGHLNEQAQRFYTQSPPCLTS